MNKLFKSIGAFFLALLGMFAGVFKSLFTFEGRDTARRWCARKMGGAMRGYRIRGSFAGACALLGVMCCLSAHAAIVEFSQRNVIYLDSTGTNGCGFVNGNLVTKRGETYTTNQNLTLTYMSGANKTNSATFVSGVLTSTNTVNP